MKLYYFPGACSLATHIVLEWLNIPYDTVKLDLASTKSPEYLALNPLEDREIRVFAQFLRQGGKNHPVESGRPQNLKLIFPMTNGPLWMSMRLSLRSLYLSPSK